MMTLDTLKNQLLTMKNDAIDIIKKNINRINNLIEDNTDKQYRELRFKTPIPYKNINGIYYENILYISISDRRYIIITRHDTSEYLISLEALKIEQLFSIVEQLEQIQSFNDIQNFMI
jgi:hypothetical protein